MKEIDPKPNLGELLLIFRRNILESIQKEGFKDDLTFSQVEVLRFVGQSGKKTMKNIADYLKVAPPSATEIISEMEKKNLVRRTSNKNDRRIVFITLSPRAKKLFSSLSKRKDAIFKKMTSKLLPRDRKTLERIIRIIVTQ
ncbi:MAG TPA: MarR family transcriptional regulator [Candidatus Paceibacterota bacterium]|jgi:DNA-binding MarR family transcriptional regulator|nr:MarR family transcriptional regulator [Candidatus Paceibacterota bacterium]